MLLLARSVVIFFSLTEGPKRTRKGPKRARNRPKSSSLTWDGRGVGRDGGVGGGKGKRIH